MTEIGQRYQLLPDLRPDERAKLEESIQDRGVKIPVVVDECGHIIDGHHRAAIAARLNIDYPTVIERGLSEGEKRILAAELNVARRHLTDAQKTKLGRDIEPDIAQRAHERQLAALRRGVEDSRSGQLSGTGKETRDEVAKAVGLGSGRSYERYRRVLEDIEDQPDGDVLMRNIESGDWQIADAQAELRDRRNAAAKERARQEQAQAAHLMGIVGDPHGNRARATLKADFSKARLHARESLIGLSVEAIVSVIEPEDIGDIKWFIRDMRAWLDQLEAGLKPSGIRLITQKGA